ncbi:BQ2448_920 [Microbotryum intermedium]|uniref:BQ2448_920 protein n=1 Tax=Microbotryum intermedium TaxID=269621 RepID=A0A238F7R9_9BASI|nr:BQ2448_920 [Microbotryum intermedium]
MEEDENPMFGPFFGVPDYDPHVAKPPDLLHILLLGVVKYLWVSTTKKLTPDEKQELVGWFASQSSRGLGEQIKGDFYVRASASCVGKDFRVIAQVFSLIAYFLQQRMWISQSLAECWMTLGKLARHAMRSDTEDLDEYAIKYHYLLHLEEAIPRFGLPNMFDSSGAESANKTVRDYCMHSNRDSPTRDIAREDSQAHRMVFISTGGRWEANGGDEVTAGPSVSRFFASPEGADFRRDLSLDDLKKPKVDDYSRWSMGLRNVKTAMTARDKIDATQACAALHQSLFDLLGPMPSLQPGQYVKLPNGDHFRSRDWCFVQASQQDQRRNSMLLGQPRVAKIIELWTVDGPPHEAIPPFGLRSVVLIFANIGDALADTGFLRMERTEQIAIVRIETLLALAMVRHDCSGACHLSEGARPICEEGFHTGRIARGVVHCDDDRFLLSAIHH